MTHVLIGFANPFLICDECKSRVPYWHDPNRCVCDGEMFNSPCNHKADLLSMCPTWNAVDGCNCDSRELHNR